MGRPLVTTQTVPYRETLASFRVTTLALCGFVSAIDGYDTQAIGYTGRLIAADLHFRAQDLGWVFSSGQLGAMLGACAFGALADGFGRRRLLSLACCLVAIFTLAAVFADNFYQFMLVRFLTGVGLGGATPCLMALGVESMPTRQRSVGAAMLYATFPMGAVIGTLVAAPLLAAHGWRGPFVLGALLPLVAAAAILVSPRESAVADASPQPRVRIVGLFQDGFAVLTLSLWAMFMLTFASIILLALWAPPLLQMLGVSVAGTSSMIAWFNVGSVFASLSTGWLLRRYGVAPVLAPMLLFGAAAWLMLATLFGSPVWLTLTALGAGLCIGGATTGLVAVASVVYPSTLRATGVGCAVAAARIGQVVMPPVIGGLIASHADPRNILMGCCVTLVFALVPLSVLKRTRSFAANWAALGGF